MKSGLESPAPKTSYDYLKPGEAQPAGIPAPLLDHKPANALTEKKVSVKRGDTLMTLLVNKALVSQDEAYNAITALRAVYDPKELRPSHEITVLSSGDKLAGIRIEKDVLNTVTLNRLQDGSFKAGQTEKAVRQVQHGVRGIIKSSLYESAALKGIPDSVILSMIKTLSWSVDFQRDIQPGDMFEVIYDQSETADGAVVPNRGDILYAKMVLSGKPLSIYRYEAADGYVGYYEDNGQSVRKALLKTPVDGARISSGFGMRRHPVLGYSKMHKGVDFAAPSGTPIYAAGDGTIDYIGRYSSYGNYVRLRHNEGYKTAYAHMKGFKMGLKKGVRVRQGDVIGYIGTTGRSTGPHLHYEILVNNAPTNPANVKLPLANSLKGKELQNFKDMVAARGKLMASLGLKDRFAQVGGAPINR